MACRSARSLAAMVERLLATRDVDAPRAEVIEPLATKTEGYSGSDIATLCKEVAMRPRRRLMARLDDADRPPESGDADDGHKGGGGRPGDRGGRRGRAGAEPVYAHADARATVRGVDAVVRDERGVNMP